MSKSIVKVKTEINLNVHPWLKWASDSLLNKGLCIWPKAHNQFAFGFSNGENFHEITISIREGFYFLRTYGYNIKKNDPTNYVPWNHTGRDGKYLMSQDEVIETLKTYNIIIEKL